MIESRTGTCRKASSQSLSTGRYHHCRSAENSGGLLLPRLRYRAGHLRRAPVRDLANMMRSGLRAQRYCRTVWIDPSEVLGGAPHFSRDRSAGIVPGDRDLDIQTLNENRRRRAMASHSILGIPWPETGFLECDMETTSERFRPIDGFASLRECMNRCEEAGRTYADMKAKVCLQSRTDLPGLHFRKLSGVVTHIGRERDLLCGDGGSHGLVIARTLSLNLNVTRLFRLSVESFLSGSWRLAQLRYEMRNEN